MKQLHTLDTFSFSYADLNKEWGCDKRYGMDSLQRFLFLNHRALDFLGVDSKIEMVGNDPFLILSTSRFAGSVPLLSPRNGKPCGDLCVGGRFGEDISELLSLIGDTLLPEYNDALPPLVSSLLEPPLYFECCNFIDKWIELERAKWNKFDVTERIEHIPSGGTCWEKYLRNSFDPIKVFSYPNRTNKLKPYHKEFCQLLSVLFLCFDELKKSKTPMRSKISYSGMIAHLQARYDKSLAQTVPYEFIEHASDPLAVKESKRLANIIIQNKRTDKRAWRIDYSEFFERYVQYIFNEVAKSTVSKTISNPHYTVSGHRPPWALNYLEPDVIFMRNDEQFVIDAKYKSHVFNWNESSDELKDVFRHDLHQILAYCSFNNMQTKQAMLVYPFDDFFCHRMKVKSPLSRTDVNLYVIGIPLLKSKVEEVKEKINNIITSKVNDTIT